MKKKFSVTKGWFSLLSTTESTFHFNDERINKSYDDSVKLKRTVIDLEYSLNGHGPELDLSKLSLACQITLQININY